MKLKTSQNKFLIDLFESGKSITTKQAMSKGIKRLSARIYDLRHQYNVDVSKMKIQNKKSFKFYQAI